jgi:uncharacterized protein YqjF (DUF2071 family)
MNRDCGHVFLTAEWRHLAMLNYAIDPAILKPLVPPGTELDFWEGRTYVSLVGFLFQNTRVRGMAIPFHRHFEEINLRFYVRRKAADGSWRRAVVFIREIVPRWAIAFVARSIYNEPYLALPTAHQTERAPGSETGIKSVAYSWKYRGREHFLKIVTRGEARPLVAGSEAEFIAEHYWGYTAQRDGSTLEYHVDHPPWRVWDSTSAEFQCDVAALYGQQYVSSLSRPPDSAFLAEGSAVSVYEGVRLSHS